MSWNENFRMLNVGEVIQKGDEYLTDTHLGWKAAKNTIGQKAPDPAYAAHRIYRRGKEASNG